MTFRVLARTLLHLGAELISSDTVAVFELVKNAFDAGSKRVMIDVSVRVRYGDLERLTEQLRAHREQWKSSGPGPSARRAILEFRRAMMDAVDRTAPDARTLLRSIEEATSWESIADTIAEANYIVVSDTGEGMSLEILNDAFLTIGTRSRHDSIQRGLSRGHDRPVLGEKGLGRLSTMRLGKRLHVESTMVGELHWNTLDIDWSQLSHESNALLEAFLVEPQVGPLKDDPACSGTRIRISGLNSDWTVGKLSELAKNEFSKLTDPFASRSVFPIVLRFNDEPVPIPCFDRLLLRHAHATVLARYGASANGAMRLTGTVHYKERQRAFALEGVHLLSATASSPGVLEALGPFELEIYWYNRRVLAAIEGIGDFDDVRRLVNEWAGGVMVFRDDFRVLPYGGRDDDWLDLDRRAFGSGGYKVNRSQIIGRLSISSHNNPSLTDQTNREGLRDSPEKSALIELLRWVHLTALKLFLEEVDKEIQAREPVAIEELEDRVRLEQRHVEDNLAELARRVPEILQQRPILENVRAALAQIDLLMRDVREMAVSYEAGRGQLLNLAGIGLTVEMLAHELNRAAEFALLTLADAPRGELSRSGDALVRTLETQLRTLQRRLRLLDPLSTAARQRKEVFDVVALVQDVLSVHAERFAQEGIECSLCLEPPESRPHFRIKAVKGMIVQVLENLVTNSVYWLRQQHILDPAQHSKIRITIDPARKEIRVWDNGPGVPEALRERVFEAFFSTKPAGEGKGLGLFIAREIARYHGADLYLAHEAAEPNRTLHTFVLTMGGMTE